MTLKAKRPLSALATRVADEELYAQHANDPRPNPLFDQSGHRKPLDPMNPSHSALRLEWMKAYAKHGGKTEDVTTEAETPHNVTKSCPFTLDKSKYPEQRTAYAGSLKSAFPMLGDNFEVLGPATPDYNCIAHTLGKHEEWVNPVTGPSGDELKGMDAMYKQQGYKRLPSKDYSYVPGKQKIVVYATMNPDGTIKAVTHGAIQDNTGAWTSKLGQLPLIRHETPDALDGDIYGEPVAVYEK